jgi:hypothetical protein
MTGGLRHLPCSLTRRLHSVVRLAHPTESLVRPALTGFPCPSNAFAAGRSYLCFSRAGIAQEIHREPRATTQVLLGAVDLDIAPARPGATSPAGRIWCRGGTPIHADLAVHPKDGMTAADVSFAVVSPSRARLIGGSAEAQGTIEQSGLVVAMKRV